MKIYQHAVYFALQKYSYLLILIYDRSGIGGRRGVAAVVVRRELECLLIITSTADELSGLTTSMTLNDLESQKRGFSEFFCDFRLHYTF